MRFLLSVHISVFRTWCIVSSLLAILKLFPTLCELYHKRSRSSSKDAEILFVLTKFQHILGHFDLREVQRIFDSHDPRISYISTNAGLQGGAERLFFVFADDWYLDPACVSGSDRVGI